MQLLALKPRSALETRAPVDPTSVKKLLSLGIEVVVESGAGLGSQHPDTSYQEAGASITDDVATIAKNADIVIRVDKPTTADIALLKRGALHLSFLDPFANPDLLEAFAQQAVTAISLEMIPRTTLAQKMDAISSQANLAGYVGVITAAERSQQIFPMMMTPAGTISPTKVFVLGVGVAGLQAIATAKRLGARVTAFDVRPEALEQAESLGAKALRIDLGGDTTGTDQGYARQLTDEQLQRQQEAQAKVCAQSDIVITTAKVFGRKPPVLIKKDVVDQMKRGSIIVDLAAETGGNVEGIVSGEETTTDNGVLLVGLENFEGRVATHATQVLAANFANMIEHFWDTDAKNFPISLDDEILKGCVLTHDGSIVHERFTK